ncbi:MAG: ABC transporter substrate-binding protein [Roseburia sp.]|nr:ABC transporter substrate-binding protein [Ruminococcus sp.]MCM1153815.1 ABC transporter substrate-binding protein [Roseburia sp.]MCM1243287.1 ABC transporter substrate-binding protein [Roseburia sp.]
MKKKILALLMAVTTMAAMVTGCGNGNGNDSAADTSADGKTYKVAIVQYVDDASLNQIVSAVQAQLDAKGAELGVTFDYADYTYNGQADATTMNQIATDLIASEVDIIVPVATPVAMVMQNATAESPREDGSLIPIVFSAVSDPIGAGLVADLNAPGSNITGTSDALNTDAVFDLMFAADPDIGTVGLLYDKSQDSSTAAIAAAKAYCEEKGVTVVEKTGTNNGEISLAADALVAAGAEAVFTPTDNNVMTAELAIYEKFIDAGVPHYCGADSFALNGAFLGYGVNYEELGTATADMVVEILVNGADPASTPVVMMDNGIATVNTETAEAIGLDYGMFADMCTNLVEIQTAEEFSN